MDPKLSAYMSKVGIGRRYHDMSLTKHPFVEDFIDRGEFDEVASGDKGLLVVGREDAREACILIARWFALSKHTVCVISALALARRCANPDDEGADEVLDSNLLVVTNIQHDKDNPLMAWQKELLSDYLRGRLSDNQPTVVLSTTTTLDWWDTGFREFIARNFVVLEYHG